MHNWWILRRFVAWVAKVPNEHLPQKKPEKLSKDAEEQIKKKIIWDGTLLNQMSDI